MASKKQDSLEIRRRVYCARHGHSRVSTYCFGYRYCARCEAQVGDNLASIDGGAETAVIVGHNCETCRENSKALLEGDLALLPKEAADYVAELAEASHV